MVCTDCGTQHGLEAALRDRGNEFNFTYSATVASVPDRSRTKFANWLHNQQSISLQEALARTRNLPVVVVEAAWDHQVQKLRTELDAMSVDLDVRVSGRHPNPVYGPLFNDRLCHASGPAFGEPVLSESGIELPKDWSDELLVCQHCFKQGKLLGEFPEGSCCPNCKQAPVEEIARWMT